ncbi:hypothetical protein A4A49_65512, partial [Nicotiana attenuata]
PQIDHLHPLYLQPSNTPGAVLIDIKLTGPENYGLWSRSMRLALLGKNKLGFVEGTCVKSLYKEELADPWEQCNDMERFGKSNLTRFYHLWTQIGALTQGTDSVTTYLTKMKDFWDEQDTLLPGKGCNCKESEPFFEMFYQQHLVQFLVGLNETYAHVRSQILLKTLVISVNEAYALVIQEESQRALGVMDMNKEPLTMLAGRGQMMKGKMFGIFCEHCGYKGHQKENCYRIVGYPPDFKSKRKPMHEKGAGGFKPYANNTTVEGSTSVEGHRSTEDQSQGHYFTEEEYKQLVDLLNKSSTADYKVNMAGIVSMLSSDCLFEWIIDSGASHHITSCKEKLIDVNELGSQVSRKVQVPTGNKSQITDIGSAIILDGQRIKDFLHVPDFKFNLLSVSKLTKDLVCTVKFFPDFCLLQGLYSGKVMGIGRETDGLYIL